MLSIEEIKLLIDKLEKLKGSDFDKLIKDNLKILKDIATTVDAYNNEQIDRLDKTLEWFNHDRKHKISQPFVDDTLFKQVQQKIYQFGRSNHYKSLEIGPGNGMFSTSFKAWAANYFIDITNGVEIPIRRMFPRQHQKYLTFYKTRKHDCYNIPQASCNFVFSWDTFVFFTQNHIQHYLHDIQRIMIPGAYGFIHYADCHYDQDLQLAKRGYWNYNTKDAMQKIIEDEGYQVVEMNSFRPTASYAIFRKPGKQNPVQYKVFDFVLD
tara:strand:- start:1335 stop:2132 length:798 start_codon:yes stop_codon:yes gene_type:complete